MTYQLHALRVCLGLLLALSAQILAAAETGRVLGVLKDQKGAVVQGARVDVKALDSNLKHSTLTDHRDNSLRIPAGGTQVSAASPGFETAVQNEIRVIGGKDSAVDLVLGLARTETVVVMTRHPQSAGRWSSRPIRERRASPSRPTMAPII